jgi:hypothetical protein
MSYLTTNINTNTETNTKYIMCHTDPNNDIDDEIAFGYLVRSLLKHTRQCNIYMLVSVKTKNVNRLLDFGVKPFTGYNLNPEFNFENKLPLNGNTLTIVFHDGTTFIPDNYFPDYVLSIAPCLDSVIRESNLVNLRGFSHQGLPGSWVAFNDVGSKNIVQYMIDKNIPYKITTPVESFDTLFGMATFNAYGIPDNVWGQISQDAFKQIVGRMPPTVPVNILPLAESLVNIPYAESIGKPGSNSRLVLKIRSLFTGTIKQISQEQRDLVFRACCDYVDNLIESARIRGSIINPINHYEQTIQSVFEMTIALAEMNMPYLHESEKRLIYSTDGNLFEQYPEAFTNFKIMGIYTPAYDLVAVDKLCILLLEDGVVY